MTIRHPNNFIVSIAFCVIFLATTFHASQTNAAPSLEEMAGAMIMCGFRGLESPDPTFLSLLAQGHIGHVILFDRDVQTKGLRNILSRPQLTKLIERLHSAKNGPMLIAVDQEGGKVARLKPKYGFSDLPEVARMGHMTKETVQALALQSGKEMRACGINLDFAPVVDVATGSSSIIAQTGRSFHSDPHVVSSHGQAFAEGLWKAGVIPTLKHFPGIGCADHDTHLGSSDVATCFSKDRDLLPYNDTISKDFHGMIMVGHVQTKLDTKHPASLSSIVINGLLRKELGWKGVVISDDLQMGAIVQHYSLSEAIRLAIEAGVDILLFGNNLNFQEDMAEKAYLTLIDLVYKGIIPKKRIVESYIRIQNLIASLPD